MRSTLPILALVLGTSAVAGEASEAFEAPASDATVVALGRAGAFDCTGVRVALHVVLTARHCLPLREATISADARTPHTTWQVVRSVPHPHRSVDLAVLLVAFDDPGPVASLRLDPEAPRPRGDVHVVGYGAPDVRGRVRGGVRRTVALRADSWGCDGGRAASTGCRPHETVVPARGTLDSCRGDSGGPLFARDDTGRWTVAGIVSRSVNGASRTCGDGGIYTRLDAVGDWVRTTIDDLEREAGEGACERCTGS